MSYRLGRKYVARTAAMAMVELVTIVEDSEWMYNLTVDQAHSFFVGEGEWLAHNICRPDPKNLPIRNNRGDPTHGILDINGDHIPLKSGRNGAAYKLPENTPGMGRPEAHLTIRDHAEAHAAAEMRIRGANEADLYLNNIPCGKPDEHFTCKKMLPYMLPENARLNVYVRNDATMRWEFFNSYVGLPDIAWEIFLK